MKVEIRPLCIEDAYTSVKWRNDNEVFKYTGTTYDKEILLQDELNWIEKILNETNSLRYGILVDNIYIGNVYITDIEFNVGQYHIFIGEKSYWGKGIAYTASLLLFSEAKNKKLLYKVYSFVKLQNKSSIILHKKLGFELIKKENEVFLLERLIN